jgi:hypothetical protein
MVTESIYSRIVSDKEEKPVETISTKEWANRHRYYVKKEKSMDNEINWKVYKHFEEAEFSDNKGKCWIAKKLVDKLSRARIIADISFRLSSACRNEEQNKDAGGSATSSHLKGLAVDISCIHSGSRFKIVRALIQAGFTRIGISKTFIHVDIDSSKPQNLIWIY